MTGNARAAIFAAAAHNLIGVPFRLHGRDPATGLDCVGLVGAALEAAGSQPEFPANYTLRNTSIESLLQFAARNGFAETGGRLQTGDLLLVVTGPAQFHLVIATNAKGAAIHAHAGLRRVVLTPAPLPWSPVKHWRLVEPEGH